MNLKPTEVRHVAVIGAGVIGGGWAAHFLRQGMNVTVWDPDPASESKLRHRLQTAVWPILEQLGLKKGASLDKLDFAPTLDLAVTNAQFIQENTPERLPIKIDTFQQIDAACPAESIIASSTSGYLMSEIAVGLHHPERCLVAHPFNPPYLMPLVEVVAGAQTSPQAHDWAVEFYRATGKQPLKLSKEVPGFVADRLMEAVWREILHMLDHDMATVYEIDAAMRYGPGLRWALMGALTVLHLGGGEGGMAHLIHQFGPSLKAPWTFLEAPELTDELAQKVIDGCQKITNGRSIQALEKERDALLIQLIDMLEQSQLWHLGNPAFERTQEAEQLKKTNETKGIDANKDAAYFKQFEHQQWHHETTVPAPLALYHCRVPKEWIDYNGHMTESAYLWAFGEASDALFRYIGIDEDYREAGTSFYTVETHINFYLECRQHDPLIFKTQVLDLDEKRLHLFHSMIHGDSQALIATTEQMLLHVDSNAAKASPIQFGVMNALTAVYQAHRKLPKPKQVGRQMQINQAKQ